MKHGFGQKAVECEAGYRNKAELAQMATHAFAVIQREAPMLEMTAQRDEADISGVPLLVEHALREKCATNCKPEDSANEISAMVPGFD